eukprot:91571-Chlamydomonas_euryale.AAC.2
MQSMMSMDGASLREAKGSAVDAAAVLAECREVAMQVGREEGWLGDVFVCVGGARGEGGGVQKG